MSEKQHVEVPSLESEGLEFKDLLIYAHFRKYMNNQTKQTFVSVDKIVSDSGISKPTILKALKRLEAANYFTINKQGKKNCYTFTDDKQFEIFGFDFLNNKDIPNTQKANAINEQRYMIKDKESNTGIIEYSEKKLAEINHLDLRTYRKYTKDASSNQLVTLIDSDKLDRETGLALQKKLWNFDAYNNLATGINYLYNRDIEKQEQLDRVQEIIKQLTKERDDAREWRSKIDRFLKLQGMKIEDIEEDKIILE